MGGGSPLHLSFSLTLTLFLSVFVPPQKCLNFVEARTEWDSSPFCRRHAEPIFELQMRISFKIKKRSSQFRRMATSYLPALSDYTYINFTRFNYYVFEQSSQRQYFASFITRRRCHKQILAWLRYAEVKHSDWML